VAKADRRDGFEVVLIGRRQLKRSTTGSPQTKEPQSQGAEALRDAEPNAHNPYAVL